MAYFAPYIDASGLNIPTFQDIIDYYVAQAESIFGSDIYLDSDAKDYQILSIFAAAVNDGNQGLQDVYEQLSPITAIGTGLDKCVAYNGITRQAASYSVCQVTLTGTASTVITNGVVQDSAGYKWDLPATTTIGGGGAVTVSATCETIGAITALTGAITIIVTPTAGWTSVTNASAAVPGQPAEADSELRARQAISTELPSQTILAGTLAAIAVLPATRYVIYENSTDTTDGNGIPGHSICAVVEGSTDALVAQAIHNNKGLGCGTFGTTTVTVTDSAGVDTDISFIRPSYVPIYVDLTIHGLTGYSATVKAAAIAAVVAYINSLQIGQPVTVSAIYGAALSVMTSLASPTFSLQAVKVAKTSTPTGTTDISMDFDKVASCETAHVTITEA